MKRRTAYAFALYALLSRLVIATTAPSAEGIVAYDSLGRQVKLSKPAARIICLSPGAAETLFAIGAGHSIIAVASSCDFPEQVKLLPKVEDELSVGFAAEGIIARAPDLVVASGPPTRGIESKLIGQGIPTFAYYPVDFTDIARTIMALGTLTGNEKVSIKLASSISEGVRRLRTVTDAIPTAQKPSILWASSLVPPETVGRGSLAQAIIDASGGRNAFMEFPIGASAVSIEEIARRAPLVIVRPATPDEPSELENLAELPGWSGLPAIRNGRVYIIPEAVLTRGGPRVLSGLLRLAKDLFPDRFP